MREVEASPLASILNNRAAAGGPDRLK